MTPCSRPTLWTGGTSAILRCWWMSPDQLAFPQMVAFPRENLFDASTHARADMRFVYFDGSRNRHFTIPATGEQEK